MPRCSLRYSLGCLSSLLLHLSLFGWGAALRGVSLWVPEAVRAGGTVRLACDYDLEDAMLYSIKWYRGDEEFYRYVPKESPPTRVFALPGVRVDISLSDAHGVTLLDVQKHLTGFYKCEVSADAPSFHTEIKSAFMTVVEAPLHEPLLSVEKARLAAGERLRANCSAPPAFPAANITWYLNSQPVASEAPTLVVPEPRPAAREGRRPVAGPGLEAALSALDLEVDGAMFLDSRLHLRCVAWLFNVYKRSSVEYVLLEDAPQLASVLGSSASGARRLRTCGGWALVSALAALVLALAAR